MAFFLMEEKKSVGINSWDLRILSAQTAYLCTETLEKKSWRMLVRGIWITSSQIMTLLLTEQLGLTCPFPSFWRTHVCWPSLRAVGRCGAGGPGPPWKAARLHGQCPAQWQTELFPRCSSVYLVAFINHSVLVCGGCFHERVGGGICWLSQGKNDEK